MRRGRHSWRGIGEGVAAHLPAKPVYAPVFARPAASASTPGVAHLDEYEAFRATVSSPQRYRFAARLEAGREYPLPEPMATLFMDPAPSGEPAQLPDPPPLLVFRPAWYDYLTFWGIPARRSHVEQQNRQAQAQYFAEVARVRADHDQRSAWNARLAMHDAKYQEALTSWTQEAEAWDRAHRRDVSVLEKLQVRYRANDPLGVAQYFALQLNAVPLPPWCPHDREVSYDADQGILLIETRLPHFGAMPIIKSRVLKEGAEDVPANQKEAREFATKFTYLMVLRLLWESVHVDVANQARLLCLNGAIAYDDPATGRRRVDTILSIAAQAQEVRELLLDRLDPEACFRKLRGVAAPRLTDLVPVAPVVRFDKADSRFIEGKEVLNGVAEMNLATMDWQDFEHLIRELFEKEFSSRGAEVRITQASRDRGVDAVVFDPDPLRGGKTIIQAKRYTNTVDLSAVRDLFGTVQAEGANKGILVTTSNFGPDAYAFVRGKPLTLVNGANLLHLLGKHGYHARIDLKQAKEFFGNLDVATKKPGKRP